MAPQRSSCPGGSSAPDDRAPISDLSTKIHKKTQQPQIHSLQQRSFPAESSISQNHCPQLPQDVSVRPPRCSRVEAFGNPPSLWGETEVVCAGPDAYFAGVQPHLKLFGDRHQPFSSRPMHVHLHQHDLRGKHRSYAEVVSSSSVQTHGGRSLPSPPVVAR
jgi:hypothetical protein